MPNELSDKDMTEKLLERQLNRYWPKENDQYYDLNKELSQKLDNIRPLLVNHRILDFGAGESPFRDFFRDIQVHTCDISQNSKKSIDTVISAGNFPLPFKDEEFDSIFMCDVLEHIEDDIYMSGELTRILKKGGLIFGNVPFLYRFHEEPFDFRRYTPSGLRYLFSKKNGLSEIEISPIGSHYFISRICLEETSFKVNKIRSIYLRFLRKLLRLGPSTDKSFNSPFSYFFVFEKPINEA